MIVPLGWWLAGHPRPYPYALDILLVSPFLVDVLGNVFDLYDAITWWDDLNHFVNWALLSLAIGQLVLRFGLPRIETFVIVVGFGAFAAIVWELGEYVAFIAQLGRAGHGVHRHARRHAPRAHRVDRRTRWRPRPS